jgi:hypothetical protein
MTPITHRTFGHQPDPALKARVSAALNIDDLPLDYPGGGRIRFFQVDWDRTDFCIVSTRPYGGGYDSGSVLVTLAGAKVDRTYDGRREGARLAAWEALQKFAERFNAADVMRGAA